jgi:hypothetical protein
MAKFKLIVALLVVIVVVSLAFNGYQWSSNLTVSKQSDKEEMAQILIHNAAEINAELLRLDGILLTACQQLSTTGLTGSQADKILSDLYTNNPSVIVNAATADANDILLAVQPSNYSNIIGQDIKDQEQNLQMHKTMRPALSNLIPLVEGFPGIVMVSPIFNPNGQFIGSFSVVFQPYQLMHPIIKDSTKGIYTIYALQSNGTLIYDANDASSGEQGKNIFTDQEYQGHTELQTFIHQVVDTQSGYGTYSYYDDLAQGRPLVNKDGYWTTIGIYNTDCRLVIARTL